MKYRVKFSKSGPIKYIGHLDVMRYFQKAIRRADIPIAYTAGFSPHQILSFAFPLSVGYTSEGEYFDMELTEEVDEDILVEKLNSVSAPGFKIIKIRKLDDKAANCMASVYAAIYRITLKEDLILPDDCMTRFNDYFGQETIPVNKPNKKGGGFIPVNLKDYIFDYSMDGRDCFFTVCAGSQDNIKASFLMDCFLEHIGNKEDRIRYNIHRIEIFGKKTDHSGSLMVPLIDM